MNRVVLLWVVLSAGCSTTTVHLYTQGIEGADMTRLKMALDAQGYQTRLNARPVPQQVVAPTLVYSPEHRDHGQLDELHQFLFELGYDVRLEPISVGNHFYTKNNVGLYLKAYSEMARKQDASGVNTEGGEELAGLEFAGECPLVDAFLQLEAGHVYGLDIITWDERSESEIVRSSSGAWAQEEDTVFLEDGRNEIKLHVEHFTDRFEVRGMQAVRTATIDGIRLRNTGDALEQCNFVIRYRGEL